jgi:hypothetical protein
MGCNHSIFLLVVVAFRQRPCPHQQAQRAGRHQEPAKGVQVHGFSFSSRLR